MAGSEIQRGGADGKWHTHNLYYFLEKGIWMCFPSLFVTQLIL